MVSALLYYRILDVDLDLFVLKLFLVDRQKFRAGKGLAAPLGPAADDQNFVGADGPDRVTAPRGLDRRTGRPCAFGGIELMSSNRKVVPVKNAKCALIYAGGEKVMLRNVTSCYDS